MMRPSACAVVMWLPSTKHSSCSMAGEAPLQLCWRRGKGRGERGREEAKVNRPADGSWALGAHRPGRIQQPSLDPTPNMLSCNPVLPTNLSMRHSFRTW